MQAEAIVHLMSGQIRMIMWSRVCCKNTTRILDLIPSDMNLHSCYLGDKL